MKFTKGQVAIFFSFIVVSFVLITIAALVAPLGTRFNIEMIAAAENIYGSANDSLQSINNATVKAAIQDSINRGFSSGTYNVTVTNSLYTYLWIILLILAAVMLYVFTRQQVEFSQGGFV